MPQLKIIAINGLFFFWFGKPLGETLGERLGETLGERLGETLGERLGETLGERLGEIGFGKPLVEKRQE